jgi:hypothetical protein
MQLKTILFSSLFIASVLAAGCGGGTDVKNTAANNSNVNAKPPANNSSLTTTTPTPVATTNNAPTLNPVYKAYCAAYVKKDEAAVRAAYTKESIAFFEKEMKADGVKTVIDYLSDDNISNEVCDVKNEIITGDSATADITTKAYPQGFRVVFEKEDGQWKLSNKRPADALK